jgi:hypothetical protein
MTDSLIAALAADPIERLRWIVARALGIAPYGQSDEQVVKCALHLISERGTADGATPASIRGASRSCGRRSAMELELSREELRALAAELLARLTGAAPAEADSANRAPAEMGTAFPPDRTGGPGPISLLGGAGENPAAADFLSAGPDRTAGGVSVKASCGGGSRLSGAGRGIPGDCRRSGRRGEASLPAAGDALCRRGGARQRPGGDVGQSPPGQPPL